MMALVGTKRPSGGDGKPAVDLLEDATQLLRRAGAGVLTTYYVGSVPAMIGFLYFFSDMSRGAFGRSRLIEEAFAVAGLYLWMKCWHTVFAAGLRSHLTTEKVSRWTAARVFRLVLIQVAVQPTGLFARLVAAQIVIPYVWVYAFYQNVGVLGDGETTNLRDLLRRAAAQTRLWPRQAHYALILSFTVAIFIALNAAVSIMLAPRLLKTFFGMETVFSRSPMALLNTTVFATIAVVTYLCFDPLRKALFVLRCFYGASLQSGDDLKVELHAIRKHTKTSAIAAAIGLFCFQSMNLCAADEPAPPSVSASQLNDSVERVMQRREYTWRMPREKAAPSEKGWLTSFVEDLFKVLGRWVKRGWDFVERGFEKLRQWFGGNDRSEEGGVSRWRVSAIARPLLYITIGVVVFSLTLLMWRARKWRRRPVTAAHAISSIPDLHSENVAADQLPEDEWLKLARELVEAGELRLALRASYLAALAHLAARDLISVARHKSNRDYRQELRRRARSREELVAAFEVNVRAFERAWYGWHDVTVETLDGFKQNLDTIRAC